MPIPGVRGGAVKKPKPFQRPGIELSTGAKKRWADVHPTRVQIGDIIQGKGLVLEGVVKEEYDIKEGRNRVWAYFAMKSGTPFYLHDITPETRIRVFTEAEGEPVG